MKLKMVAIALLILLTGCGNTAPNQSAHSDFAYVCGVIWNHKIYDIGTEPVAKVASFLGSVKKHVKGPLQEPLNVTSSNCLAVGAKIYAIPGKKPDDGIAIQLKDGGYVLAQYDSNVNTTSSLLKRYHK